MASNSFTIDTQKSRASFTVKKLGFLNIKGTLKDFTGEVVFDKENIEQAYFNVCSSPSTIDTGTAKRDAHLKSNDFFSVNEYPRICFKSTSVRSGNDNYTATGNLTILGVTKEVAIPFTFSNGAFIGHFAINRLDYNLGKKFPAFIVGKTIRINIKCKIN